MTDPTSVDEGKLNEAGVSSGAPNLEHDEYLVGSLDLGLLGNRGGSIGLTKSVHFLQERGVTLRTPLQSLNSLRPYLDMGLCYGTSWLKKEGLRVMA